MERYNEYINSIKRSESNVDFDDMLLKVKQRVSSAEKARRTALASVLIVMLLLGTSLQFVNLSFFSSPDQEMSSFILEHQSSVDTVTDYIFSD